MGNARMPDGKDVIIMSPEQWNTYCFNFNKLNDVPQPAQLLKDMHTYQIESNKRFQEERYRLEDQAYKASWKGRTSRSLWLYLGILIPLLLGIGLWEDVSNPRSPRLGMYKNRMFSIPDFNDWLMFEIVNAVRGGGRKPKKENKSAEPNK